MSPESLPSPPAFPLILDTFCPTGPKNECILSCLANPTWSVLKDDRVSLSGLECAILVQFGGVIDIPLDEWFEQSGRSALHSEFGWRSRRTTCSK